MCIRRKEQAAKSKKHYVIYAIYVHTMYVCTHTYIHPSMHALHYITLHYITFHCIALHCIALHCIALHCIALHCIALHCIALHCIALHCMHGSPFRAHLLRWGAAATTPTTTTTTTTTTTKPRPQQVLVMLSRGMVRCLATPQKLPSKVINPVFIVDALTMPPGFKSHRIFVEPNLWNQNF